MPSAARRRLPLTATLFATLATATLLFKVGKNGNERNILRKKEVLLHSSDLEAEAGAVSTASIPFRIIQVGHPHTGTTLMANLLVGLFHPQPAEAHICFPYAKWWSNMAKLRERIYGSEVCASNPVIKTHTLRALEIGEEALLELGEKRVFFVANNRDEKRIDENRKYCTDEYPNVVCFDYVEIKYNNEMERVRVVKHVAKRLRDEVDYFGELPVRGIDVDASVARLKEMDVVTKKLANMPFTAYDHKFQIRGSHRNKAYWKGTKKEEKKK